MQSDASELSEQPDHQAWNSKKDAKKWINTKVTNIYDITKLIQAGKNC